MSLSCSKNILVAMRDVKICSGEIVNPISVRRATRHLLDSLVVFVINRIATFVSLSLYRKEDGAILYKYSGIGTEDILGEVPLYFDHYINLSCLLSIIIMGERGNVDILIIIEMSWVQ